MTKQPVYLDNAATTPLAEEVLTAMLPYMKETFGNPSSTYSVGRMSRLGVETARKKVAQLLGVPPAGIYFTSGGTESNNTAIASAIRDLGCTHIITSPIEHHAVLHTVEYYSRTNQIPFSLVALTPAGEVDYNDLERQLNQLSLAGVKPLVSLMHANNEIGALLDIARVGRLCKQYNAIFHSDCVQTVGHYPLNLLEYGVHFISGAGHKFHGPKGVGILYVHSELKIQPLIHGGGQERNLRAGTENVYGIVGFARALELAMEEYEQESKNIAHLKAYMKQELVKAIPGVGFNSPDNSLYTVLSVCFPKSPNGESLLLELDMAGICVSGGSACSSGDDSGSHVIKALNKNADCNTIRFSFSKYNTIAEIDKVIMALQAILQVAPAAIAIK
ncbi:cysteine desulfurase [Niastella vici]|uniref:cysteine desulfurase n=1 Tax=Niastella vici TaxID=1703345 RepID=A0A1V9FZY2_9BACT|nr:cysteine desulfurase family protein [Niastella vici]OQP63887.1 cysteine desulfurase [Niastella vici]